jgi:hypothetical protein
MAGLPSMSEMGVRRDTAAFPVGASPTRQRSSRKQSVTKWLKRSISLTDERDVETEPWLNH